MSYPIVSKHFSSNLVIEIIRIYDIYRTILEIDSFIKIETERLQVWRSSYR